MRNLIDTIDLSVSEIENLIETALDIEANPVKYQGKASYKKLATLFFEPSTRTRLSFETAMLDLGGNVIGFSEASSSSSSKGESLRDTVRTVGCYADIIAMRHPLEGSAKYATKTAGIPIVNAGDGGHCHPTQTLIDLLTIRKHMGDFSGLTVGLCGDLKNGRTVHSLVSAMSRYENVKFCFIAPEKLAMPDYIKHGINGLDYSETTDLSQAITDLDVLYMTRVQGERFEDKAEYESLKDIYILDEEKMSLAKEKMVVLHPLPRVNEITVGVDSDSRAKYFDQVRNGKFIRMAVILKLLSDNGNDKEISTVDAVCTNPSCITNDQREPEHKAFIDENGDMRCLYCEQKI